MRINVTAIVEKMPKALQRMSATRFVGLLFLMVGFLTLVFNILTIVEMGQYYILFMVINPLFLFLGLDAVIFPDCTISLSEFATKKNLNDKYDLMLDKSVSKGHRIFRIILIFFSLGLGIALPFIL